METKNDKFKRIRDVRLPKALKSISLLGNVGATDYQASDEEKGEMIRELFDAVREVEDKLGGKPTSEHGRTEKVQDNNSGQTFDHGAFVMKSGNSKFSPMLDFEVGNGKIIASEISDMSNQLMSANYSLQLVLNKLGLAHKPEQERGITDE